MYCSCNINIDNFSKQKILSLYGRYIISTLKMYVLLIKDHMYSIWCHMRVFELQLFV